ncbi:MAG TPA: hypothetical protein VF796_25340 [Humisphaera sp.]
MPLPMIGTWTVTVNAAKPFAIHGDAYLELHVTRADDGSDHVVRVAEHALRGPVTPGGRATLTFLMGQVTELTT